MTRRGALAAALALATLLVFAPVRHFGFVAYDDDIYVVDNPNVHEGLSVGSAVRAFTELYESNWIPLTWISLQLDHAIFGIEPGAFHATNLGLHLLSVLLLFLALRRMTGADLAAAFVAGVFAIHPLHVESVAWVSERKDMLSGVFFTGALYAWARYVERPGTLRYAVTATTFALGLLAKPMGVTFPFVLLLLDDWPLRRLGPGPWPSAALLRARVIEKVPLFVLAGGAAVMAYLSQRSAGSVADFLPVPWRIANAAHAIAAYARQAVWPADLAVFYPHPMRTVPLIPSIAAGAGILAVIAACARQHRRRPYLLVGVLWFLGMLVPVIGLVQVGMQARADRYTYLPLIGLALAIAFAVQDWARGRPARARAAAAAGVCALLALGVVARRQVETWRSSETLFRRAVSVTEGNFLAQEKLGATLLASGRAEEAAVHFGEAVRIKPRWTEARLGLAEAMGALGRGDDELRQLQEAVRTNPGDAPARARLGRLLLSRGRADEAIPQLRQALALDPVTARATIEALLARALAASGDPDEAVRHYRMIVGLDPDRAEAQGNLAIALAQAGRDEEAAPHFARALELGLDSPEFHAALAAHALAIGDPERAVRHYRLCLAARPDWGRPRNNLAWLLATSDRDEVRNGEEAVRLAESLARGDAAENPAVLDTLAAAYAASGRFDEAIATGEHARERAREQGSDDDADAIEARVNAYRDGRAWIEATPRP